MQQVGKKIFDKIYSAFVVELPELPWEKEERIFNSLTEEEKTWARLNDDNKPKVYNIDIGNMTFKQASKVTDIVAKRMKEGKHFS